MQLERYSDEAHERATHPDPEISGEGARSPKKFFGPQFGLKIRWGRVPQGRFYTRGRIIRPDG